MQCEACLGYLVPRNRLKLIKVTRQQTPEALQNEAGTEGAADTTEQIRCPKCRVERMRKERVRVSADEFFFLDVCGKCGHVWLDGGELARLQIDFEKSAQAVEAFALQERLESRTDEQRGQFHERLAKLAMPESGLIAGVADSWTLIVMGALIGFGLVAIALACLWGRWGWAIVISLAVCVSLVYLTVRRIEATSRQRLVVLAVIGVAEAIFLALVAWLGFF
jgi:Zn-finger nucleic acid-binding protein